MLFEAGKQLPVTSGGRRRIVDHDDIEAFDCMLVVAEGLSHDALYSVPAGSRTTMFLRDCEAEPGKPAVVFPAKDCKPFVPAAAGLREYSVESAGVEQAVAPSQRPGRANFFIWLLVRGRGSPAWRTRAGVTA